MHLLYVLYMPVCVCVCELARDLAHLSKHLQHRAFLMECEVLM